MRVLQVHTRHREAGGEDSVVYAEAALLADAGHEVVQHQSVNPDGAGAAAVSFSQAVWNTTASRKVTRLATQWRPDVAHVHNTWFSMSPSVVVALSRLGVPVVATLHNYRIHCANGLLFRDGQACQECLPGSSLPAFRHRCYRSSFLASGVAAATIAVNRRLGSWDRHVERYIVLSQFARERSAAGGLPLDRIVVRENFTEDPGPRSSPPSMSKDVVFVGRLAPEKGLGVALRAWAQADTSGLRLVVVGDGELRRVTERAAPPGVEFVGHLGRHRVAALMLRARALIFPTLWYEGGRAMVLIEAMAAGLPFVATDQAGARPGRSEDGAVATVPSGDAPALARAIELLADPATVDSAGRRARGTYEGAYTPAHGLGTLESVYRDAIAGRRKRTTEGA